MSGSNPITEADGFRYCTIVIAMKDKEEKILTQYSRKKQLGEARIEEWTPEAWRETSHRLIDDMYEYLKYLRH